MSDTRQPQEPRPAPRRPWQTPTVTAIGTIGSILEGGNDKVTVVTGDPGEPQKVPGMDK